MSNDINATVSIVEHGNNPSVGFLYLTDAEGEKQFMFGMNRDGYVTLKGVIDGWIKHHDEQMDKLFSDLSA